MDCLISKQELRNNQYLRAEFREDKMRYVDYGDFDGLEAMGMKVMFPIPIKIEIAMDRMFNGNVRDELYRIMTVQEIKYE